MNDSQFNLMTTGFGFDNFDPAQIQNDEVILVTIACDISPSMMPNVNDLNQAFSDFVAEMQRSHVASKLMVKTIEFNETVSDKTGFQPISNIDLSHVTFSPRGMSTALADASYKAIQDTLDYRAQLEATGIQCKVLVFVITDGMENSSRKSLSQVASLLSDVNKEERNIFSFETIFFGIGDKNTFQNAYDEMMFKHLAVVGNTGKEVRKLIGFISASVSKSSSNQAISF